MERGEGATPPFPLRQIDRLPPWEHSVDERLRVLVGLETQLAVSVHYPEVTDSEAVLRCPYGRDCTLLVRDGV